MDGAITPTTDERSRPQRVAYLTQWFPPELEGIPLSIAETLKAEGFDVGVITGVPHYPSGATMAGYRATDWKTEVIKGLRVLRVPEYPSHDASVLRRVLTLGSFAVSSAVLAAHEIGKSDVSLVYSSPATSALAAMSARRRYGTPFVLYIQDLWPDSVYAAGALSSGPARWVADRTIGQFVDRSYEEAASIAVISPGMRDLLVARGVAPHKISVIYNWVDEAIYRPGATVGTLRPMLGLTEYDTVLLFAGNLGKVQGLSAWINAMAALDDLPDVHMVLVGDGIAREDLRQQVSLLGLQNQVHFSDPVPASRVVDYGADADLGVVSLIEDPLFSVTIPSKTQALLAQGVPILCSAPGDAARLIAEADAGWTCRADDSVAIAGMIRTATAAGRSECRRRGRCGLSLYRREMARQEGSKRLHAALTAAIAATPTVMIDPDHTGRFWLGACHMSHNRRTDVPVPRTRKPSDGVYS